MKLFKILAPIIFCSIFCFSNKPIKANTKLYFSNANDLLIGWKIKKNSRFLSEIKNDTTLLITIPSEPKKLNKILEDYKNIKDFHHLGHLKALCK